MRIISNFHDYYDGLSSFEKTERVYDRKQVEHSINFKREHGKGSGLHDVRWTFHAGESKVIINNRICWRCRNAIYSVLGVCGKLYPMMNLNTSAAWDDSIDDVYFYNIEGFTEFLKSKTNIKVNLRSFYGSKEDLSDMLRLLENNQLIKSFFIKYDTPIFHLRFIPNDSRDVRAGLVKNHHALTTNVKLSDFQFQKLKDAWQIYQDIDTYLGNELAVNKNVPDSTGNDVDLAKAKGFDKWSFRKEPANEKNRSK